VFPAESIQLAFFLIVLMFITSVYSLAVAWAGLIKRRNRWFYLPVFTSSLLLLVSLSFLLPATSSSFSVEPGFGPVQDLVDKTHPVLLENLRVVEYGVEVIPSRLFDDNSDNVGEYNGVFRSIVMIRDNDDLEWTYWHELAHHVWYWLLSDSERSVWVGIHAKDSYVWAEGSYPYFPTEYASTSPQEDFADSFARYVYEYHVSDEYRWNYRTENLDPERLFVLKMFFQSIFEDSDCQLVPAVACAVVEQEVMVTTYQDYVLVDEELVEGDKVWRTFVVGDDGRVELIEEVLE